MAMVIIYRHFMYYKKMMIKLKDNILMPINNRITKNYHITSLSENSRINMTNSFEREVFLAVRSCWLKFYSLFCISNAFMESMLPATRWIWFYVSILNRIWILSQVFFVECMIRILKLPENERYSEF